MLRSIVIKVAGSRSVRRDARHLRRWLDQGEMTRIVGKYVR